MALTDEELELFNRGTKAILSMDSAFDLNGSYYGIYYIGSVLLPVFIITDMYCFTNQKLQENESTQPVQLQSELKFF